MQGKHFFCFNNNNKIYGEDLVPSKMHLSPPEAKALVRSKAVVLLLIRC